MNCKKWSTKADENGNIQFPDELVPLLNKVGFQIRFHTISGKNEIATMVDICRIAQEFFSKHPEFLLDSVDTDSE